MTARRPRGDAPGFRRLPEQHGPRPKRPRPDLIAPTGRLEPNRRPRDWRPIALILGLGLVFALGPFVPGWVQSTVTTLEGEGYVRWRYPAWKAKQAAEQLGLPLVIVRADAASADYERFVQRVLAHPKLNDVRGHAVWLREPLPADGVATLGVYEHTGAEAHFEPRSLSEVDPLVLSDVIFDLAPDGPQGDGGGIGFW